MIKVNFSVIQSVRLAQYRTLSQEDFTKFVRQAQSHRKRIYADNDLLTERGASVYRLVGRVEEECALNIGRGDHCITLEQLGPSNDVEYIISGLSINGTPVDYQQDSLHQITFKID